ncbi:hypothetical protein ACNKHV_03055 [Shigella flexneri]
MRRRGQPSVQTWFCSGIAWRSTTFSDWLRVELGAEVCFPGGSDYRIWEYTGGEGYVNREGIAPTITGFLSALRFGIGEQRGEFFCWKGLSASAISAPVDRSGRNILTS